MNIKTNGLTSKNTFLLIVIILSVLIFKRGFYSILTWDTMGYQSYLPLVFDQHSFAVKLDYFRVIMDTYQNTSTLYQYVDLENGNVFIKYPIGWAMLMLPFYSIAEVWCSLIGGRADGFSQPYQIMAFTGSVFYTFLGVFALLKLMKLYFTDRIASLVAISFYLGTNLLFMSYSSVGINHNLVFTMICLFLIQNERFHREANIKNAILLGLILGLCAAVRPPSVLIALFALFYQYGDYGKNPFKKILFFIQNHLRLVLAAVFTFLLVYSPQLIYWKLTSGHWIINSYANNMGEGFDWLSPYTHLFLFSFRKGALLYTPILILCFIGFYYWIKQNRSNGLVASFTFLLFLYVVSCWTTWWYAGSFGSRALVDFYPLLALALGSLLTHFPKKRMIYLLLGACIVLNLFQTYQMSNHIIHESAMTRKAYFANFFRVRPFQEGEITYFDVNYEDELARGIDLKRFGKVKQIDFEWDYYPITRTDIYHPAVDISMDTICLDDHLWVKTTWQYRGNASDLKGMLFTSNYFFDGHPYHWRGYGLADAKSLKVDTIQKLVVTEVLTLPRRTNKDVFRTGIWNESGDSLHIKPVKMEVYRYTVND